VRVLIVEDEYFIGLMAVDALRAKDHEAVGPAQTVQAALTLAREANPDVAVLDYRLPDGTGAELAEALRTELGVPSIFATGSPVEALEAAHLVIGVLTKPYTPDDLVASVKYVRARAAGKPASAPKRLMLTDREAPRSSTWV
jgi:DNA-binding response OmpR family regulator